MTVGYIVVGGIVVAAVAYAGYKAYKFAQGVGKTISSALQPARSIWESRPKILFKGMEQGGVVMAGGEEPNILGGLVQ